MKRIFVFGSNEAGLHSGGAARDAYIYHGAIDRVGFGPQGQSFAIPTVDWEVKKSLELKQIEVYVDSFIRYARIHPEFEFRVTQIGCGIAGFSPIQIAPMFLIAPENCLFDNKWKKIFDHYDHKYMNLPEKKYWGTF